MTTDPRELLEQLDTVYSSDFDAYASGRLPAHAVRCLMCESVPCECEARGLVFGSAAYFARMDAMHGRTSSAAARICSAPECSATARVGEHPAGIAVSGSGGDSFACMVDVRPRVAEARGPRPLADNPLPCPDGCEHPLTVHSADLGCWLCDCTHGREVAR